jgi:hypothetical protein
MKQFYLCTILCLAFLAADLFDAVHASAKTDAVESATAAKSAPSDFAHQIYVDSNTQKVGIGTKEPAAPLDVYHGEIKIGSSGAPCTAILAGAIRYADSKLQICDGTGWRNVSLDKAQ